MKAIGDNSGKFYIFGGEAVGSPGEPPYLLNDTVIFDTVTLSWAIDHPDIIPKPRAFYSATLLSNGVIVYIGGYDGYNSNIVDISQISLYYTNSSKWSIKTAKLSSQIESRSGHTAVLGTSGKIIVYGGSKTTINIHNAKVVPDIAVLNTETEPFEWTAPTVSGKDPPSLVYHTADRVGGYMIVAFGNITQINAEPSGTNPNIYLMDIRNYTWVNAFEPITVKKVAVSPTETANEQPTASAEDNSLIIIVLATIAEFIIAIIIIIGFLICKDKNNLDIKENNQPNDIVPSQ